MTEFRCPKCDYMAFNRHAYAGHMGGHARAGNIKITKPTGIPLPGVGFQSAGGTIIITYDPVDALEFGTKQPDNPRPFLPRSPAEGERT